ncbi:MAG: immunoglobulin domain-containing protein [Pseudomonadota bacterium]|nr:immunoglobulin domain-containing protein [Pseudomonadota bacterium]
MLKQTLLASLIGTTLLISACGGGGGDSGSQNNDLSQLSLSFKTNLPAKITATEGETLSLSVEVLANRPGGVDYEWFFNDQRIDVPKNTSTLLVRDITADQQGKYRVIVRDIFREKNFIASNTTQVQVERKQSKPTFGEDAGTFSAIIGDDVTLNPVATGFPTPKYQWYKDGKILTGQTGAILDLKNAQKEDSGVYYVIGKNSLGDSKSAEYQVNVTLQLATGVWFGTLNQQNAVFAVAPNGQFIFNAASDTQGSLSTTGSVRTTSLLQDGSNLRFHPKSEVSTLMRNSNGSFIESDTTISLSSNGISFIPQSHINSKFVQINIPTQLDPNISIPNWDFAQLDLEYDTLISNLVTTPQDMSGVWKMSGSNDSLNHQITIDADGNFTGTLFEGNCEILKGKIAPAEDSQTLYTTAYKLVQPEGKNCPVGLLNPSFKGLAFRIPDTTTGEMRLYMASYFLMDKKVASVQPLFLSR